MKYMMVYDEEDYLQLSGIQHFVFCRRQWALIHIEQQWEENVRTIEGQHLHQRTDEPMIREKRGDKLIVRALPVQSARLGITGICDVVEFVQHPDGIHLTGEEGRFLPYPVEYKRGKPKKDHADIMQLTAQVICLEEMLVCQIDKGYLYYHEIKHRVEVPITLEYRKEVERYCAEMHHYFRRHHTPKVKTGSHCRQCSLQHICLPEMLVKKSVASYIAGRIRE